MNDLLDGLGGVNDHEGVVEVMERLLDGNVKSSLTATTEFLYTSLIYWQTPSTLLVY